MIDFNAERERIQKRDALFNQVIAALPEGALGALWNAYFHNDPQELERARALIAATNFTAQIHDLKASYKDFRHALATFDRLPAPEIERCVLKTARWVAVLPSLRFYGENPCWRADCPLCKADLDLWVTPVDPGEWLMGDDYKPDPKNSWICHGCGANGPDPESLATAMRGVSK